MFTYFSLTRNADGMDSARLRSILPVSNNIAELPGLGPVVVFGPRLPIRFGKGMRGQQ